MTAYYQGQTQSETFDYKDSMETVDFSLNIGLDVDLSKKFFLEARITNGLTDIFKNDQEEFNTVYQFSVGYRF